MASMPTHDMSYLYVPKDRRALVRRVQALKRHNDKVKRARPPEWWRPGLQSMVTTYEVRAIDLSEDQGGKP